MFYPFLIFIFFLPLLQSRIFGIESMILDGNYEFFKSTFFVIIGSVLVGGYFLVSRSRVELGRGFLYFLLGFLGVASLSTYMSVSSYISFFGDTSKGHGFVFFFVLSILSIFIYQVLDENKMRKIFELFIWSSLFVSIIGIKEYYYPSYDYGENSRLISTLGQPNYVAGFFLLIIPYLYHRIFEERRYIYVLLLAILFIAFILTKSYIGVGLLFVYSIYFWGRDYKKIVLWGVILSIIGGLFLVYELAPYKLSSFVSRFFIWESIGSIGVSDFKSFFIGNGFDSMPYLFDSFKSFYLYIFENIGYSADRAHNIILDFFYSLGLLGAGWVLFIFYFVFRNYKDNWVYNSVILFLMFNLFNFPITVSYVIFIILLVYIVKENSKNIVNFSRLYLVPFVIIGLFFGYMGINKYIAETYMYRGNYLEAIKIFEYNPTYHYKIGDFETGKKMEKKLHYSYYLNKIELETETSEKNKLCQEFVLEYASLEGYFYCGKVFESLGEDTLARFYYEKGIEFIPDYKDIGLGEAWEEDIENRLYSERYGLKNILDYIKNWDA